MKTKVKENVKKSMPKNESVDVRRRIVLVGTYKGDQLTKWAMPQRDNPPSRCALPPSPRLRWTRRRTGRRSSEPPSRERFGGPGALLEYAVMQGDEVEAECIREELHKLTESV